MAARVLLRLLIAVSAITVAMGAMVAAGGPASAASAVICPTVDPGTGAVSPTPAPGEDWAGCDLHGANLAGAALNGSNLGTADLSGATLAGANLQAAFLRGANLSSASLTGANLSFVLMDSASIAGTGFASANLDALQTGQDTGTPASLPAHWIALDGYLIGPAADLSHADLGGTDLSGLDLAGTSLFLAHLEHANLANADLRGADLTYAFVPGADLGGTDITGANLYGISSGQVTGTPTGLPAPWVLRGGYFLGPHANLTSARLAGLNLTGTDLAGAWFVNAHLFGADLAGVDLAGANMWAADLRGADLFGADVARVNWTVTQCPGIGGNASGCGLAFRFGQFATPRPGAAIRTAARSIPVRFTLLATTAGQGTPVASTIAAAIASARRVRVVLTGKGITPVAGYCGWDSRHGVFQCAIQIPRHIATGRSHPYKLTVQENPQGRFVPAATVYRTSPNPEIIYFTTARR